MPLFQPGWFPQFLSRFIPSKPAAGGGTTITMAVTAGVLTLSGQELFFQEGTPAGIGTLTLVPSNVTLIATGGLTVTPGQLTLSGSSLPVNVTMPVTSRTLTL